LAATIKKERPDLLPNVNVDGSMAISEEPPPSEEQPKKYQVEDIGEPTLANFFTLSSIDPQNW